MIGNGVVGWLEARRGELAANRAKTLVVSACVALSLVVIWGFQYHPGIDLPEHAHLFELWANLGDEERGLDAYYRSQFFTPYLSTYLLALPFAKLGGAFFAVKVVLTVTALATPYFLWRWLDAIDGERSWALFGFVLAFGYHYLWGFTSFGLSLPVAFFCFEAWTRSLGRGVRWPLLGSVALVLCFFTHAVTFAVTGLSLGLLTLVALGESWASESSFRARVEPFARRAVPLALAGGVSLAWYLLQGRGAQDPPHGFPQTERFAMLFGGELHVFDAYWASAAGLLALLIVGATGRPILRPHLRYWLPFAIALTAFLALPDFLMSTAFVGPRFIVLAHAFAPVAFVNTPGVSEVARRSVAVIVLLFLAFTVVRLDRFNREMDGFSELTALLPLDADVRGNVPPSGNDSPWGGPAQFVNIYAWATAERGGFVFNDHGRYFQLPIRRRSDVPFPSRFPYVIGHGPDAKRAILREARGAQLLFEKNGWVLFQDPKAAPPRMVGARVVRWAQDWGELRSGVSVAGSALKVGGTQHPRGWGSHARAIIELRAEADGVLRGACGVDDGAKVTVPLRCWIEDVRGETLFGVNLTARAAAQEFSVPVRGGQRYFLRAAPVGSRDVRGAHVDWIDPRVEAR